MAQAISEIKKYLEECNVEALSKEMECFSLDERKGVQKFLESCVKRVQKYQQELLRLEGLLAYERECYQKGYTLVAGIDEVGRGPLAGPVVTAAVILPKDCRILGVNDSKKLSAKKREELYGEILEKAVAYGFGVVPPSRIDEINILQATYEAMRMALDQLSSKPEFILVDAVTIPRVSILQKGIVKGDAKSMSIGAASIIAKVYRDSLMQEYDELYPEYGFAANKGYGSAAHIATIKEIGICPIHRKSFVKNFVKG